MYIVINNDNVVVKRSLKQLNKKLKTNFSREEFKKYNADYVMQLNDDDLDFKKDCNELNRIFISKLYKKDMSNLINYGFYILLIILILITLTSVKGINGAIMELLEQLPKVVR